MVGLVPVRAGVLGAAVSTSRVTPELAALTFPAWSCAVAVKVYVPSASPNESANV